MVGIACETSGLWVLDLDRHPGKPNGVAEFEHLVNENGGDKVITAAAQSTPGAGWHLVFDSPEISPDFELPATLAPGIDIRYRGYICSGTLVDGRAYQWQWLPGWEHAPAYPPEWISKMIVRYREKTHFEQRPKKARQTKPGYLSPGDDFANKTDWSDILPNWALAGGKADVGYLTRPGKGKGVSASINYSGKDNLYVFTTNAAPFEAGKSYSKLMAYALLNHDGDMKAAARALAAKGYGSRTSNK